MLLQQLRRSTQGASEYSFVYGSRSESISYRWASALQTEIYAVQNWGLEVPSGPFSQARKRNPNLNF